MKNKLNEVYQSIEEYEEKCYLFSPSISKQKTYGDKSYFVRLYFTGGKDFEKTMKKLATEQARKIAR